VFFFVCFGDAIAQEKAAVYVGPFDVTPSIDLSLVDDDNIFEATNGNEISSRLTLLRPSFSAVADDDVTAYTVEYQLEKAVYSNTNNNDYINHDLSASMDWQINVRHLLELNASVVRNNETRSFDSVTSTDAADLNKSTDRGLAANYTFGSEGARGRIAIGFETNSLRYLTNLDDTGILESDTNSKNIEMSLGFSPSTRLTFQVIDTENTFRNDSAANRDGLSYLMGAQWDFTGVTKGSVSFGQTENDLVNVPAGETTTDTWAASIEWLPREYSVFTLTANRGVQNTDNDVGSFVDTSEISVDWMYQWNDQLSMQLSFQQEGNDFIDGNRNDDTDTVNLAFIYALRRWVSLSFGLVNEQRSSDNILNVYEKNTATLSINANL
jgi:hypothetical protein